MYKRILVATDGSRLSGKAVSHAIELARAVGARLVAFHASPEYGYMTYSEGSIRSAPPRKEYEAAAAREAQQILDGVVKKAATAGVDCETVHLLARAPWEAILDTARQSKADAIVMASHGRSGVTAMLLGSETQKVLTHAKLPVIVVR